MSNYYYPEGPLGPICDVVGDDAPKKKIIFDEGDGREYTYGPLEFPDMEAVMPGVPALTGRRCKKRTLSDGTIEYYDCEDTFLNPLPESDTGLPSQFDYDWKTNSQSPWGLDDDFEEPDISEISCSPFDPDQNIIPVRVYNSDGTFVTRVQTERSSPVTFNVTSEDQTFINDATITAEFSTDQQNLVIGGTGDGIVQLELDWNDKPSISGQAIGTLTVAGASMSQGNKEKGTKSVSVQVTAGQSYPIVLSGNSGTSGSRLASSTVIEYDDDVPGFDVNATLRIADILPLEPTSNVAGYWSDEGNKYAVWTNPAICTLPQIEQQVTYQIPIPETGTYGFEFACDDNAQMFLNGSNVAFMNITGGIFEGGSLNVPYTSTTTLNAGTLELVVKCTNSDAGFNDGQGNPTGLAYSWQRNPGGWYIKICQGGNCIPVNNIPWVASGPHPAWSDFMNLYAVWVSSHLTESGSPKTATWNIPITDTGNYQLDVQADNQAVISFDGVSQGTVNSFTTTTSYSLNNITAGGHTLQAVVTNNVETVDNWSNNPAGVAWTLTKLNTPSNITAKFKNNGDLQVQGSGTGTIQLNFSWDETPEYTSANVSVAFDSNGNLVATGTGSATVQLDFEWNDNPNTYGQALGTVAYSSLSASFTQTLGARRGNSSQSVTVTAGNTYNVSISNNPFGFTLKDNGGRLCFYDGDGQDCNASLFIGTVTQAQTEVAADNAVESYSVAGYTFTTGSSNTGSSNATINVTAGTTYPATIVNNPNGFSLKNSKTKICFQDSLGTDCNAQITIGTVNNNNQNAIVASSLDLSSDGTGNLIWHTRLASGYEYTDV